MADVARSATLTRILGAVSEGITWALAISAATGIPESTTYGALERFEAAGWMQSQQEPGWAFGRPRRRLYRLTAVACDALSRVQPAA